MPFGHLCDLNYKFDVWQGYALKGPLPLDAVVESTAGLLLN
jgi:hypothetical protein